MTLEEHCRESIKLFGKSFEEVHKWLDEFAGTPGIGMKHRKIRHHQEGIMQIEKLFGKDAAKVAKQHIISDLKEEGWIEEVHEFPRNEEHYINVGMHLNPARKRYPFEYKDFLTFYVFTIKIC